MYGGRPDCWEATEVWTWVVGGGDDMVQVLTSAPLQKGRATSPKPKPLIKMLCSEEASRKGSILLRRSSWSAARPLVFQYRKVDLNVDFKGSVKFQTVSEIVPLVLPWLLVTVNVPEYWPATALRGTSRSTQRGWLMFAFRLNGTATRAAPLPDRDAPVAGSVKGTRPSGYQPAPRG